MSKRKIIIIGGGIAGVTAALELADNPDVEVTLVEANDELLDGTSNRTPCRYGLGLHYPDPASAIKYLHATLHFWQKYPDYRLAQDDNVHAYLRRGHYLFVNPSEESDKAHVKDKDIETMLEELQEAYNDYLKGGGIALEKDDTGKKLYKKQSVDGLDRRLVNTKIITNYMETLEGVLDWPRLKQDLLTKVASKANITVIKQHEAVAISQNANPTSSQERLSVVVKNKKSDDEQTLTATQVINASWHNIEHLRGTLGPQYAYDPKTEPRTLRLKMMVHANLPAPGELRFVSAKNKQFIKLVEKIKNEELDLENTLDNKKLPEEGEKTFYSDEEFKKLDAKTQKSIVLQQLALDRALEKLRQAHSMFYCFGPHASFTQLGEDEKGDHRGAFITYEPETNIEATQAMDIPASWLPRLRPGVTLADLDKLNDEGINGQKDSDRALAILSGAGKYIPILGLIARMQGKNAIKGVSLGIVRTLGMLDLSKLGDPKAPHNKRDSDDIREIVPGVFELPAMKLLFAFKAAEKIRTDFIDPDAYYIAQLENYFNLPNFSLEDATSLYQYLKRHIPYNADAKPGPAKVFKVCLAWLTTYVNDKLKITYASPEIIEKHSQAIQEECERLLKPCKQDYQAEQLNTALRSAVLSAPKFYASIISAYCQQDQLTPENYNKLYHLLENKFTSLYHGGKPSPKEEQQVCFKCVGRLILQDAPQLNDAELQEKMSIYLKPDIMAAYESELSIIRSIVNMKVVKPRVVRQVQQRRTHSADENDSANISSSSGEEETTSSAFNPADTGLSFMSISTSPSRSRQADLSISTTNRADSARPLSAPPTPGVATTPANAFQRLQASTESLSISTSPDRRLGSRSASNNVIQGQGTAP